MPRLPIPGSDEGKWGDILNDFLSTSLSASGTLKEGSVGDTQISSVSQAKVLGLTPSLSAKANRVGAQFSRGATIADPIVSNVVVWRASFACRVKKVLGYRVGGTGATINARKNGASTHLPVDLSVSTPSVWTDGGTVQNTDYAIGDSLEIMITAVSGTPTQIAIQIDLETV